MLNNINREIQTVEVRLNGKLIGIYTNMNFATTSLKKKNINYNTVSYHYGSLTEKQNESMFWKLIREGKIENSKTR